jgi:hypothetical protein
MGTHQNADKSVSDGVKVEAPGTFIGHQIGLVLTASVQLTMPGKGETQAIVQADGNDVRFRLDGTAPTATVGFLIKNGTSITLSAADAAAAKFIQTASAALLNAWFTL